jgi:hypothetical protein
MTTKTEYQQFADECMRSAREAKTDAERKAFLDMARAWTKMADAGPIADEPGRTSH